jgi:hypothetical protein
VTAKPVGATVRNPDKQTYELVPVDRDPVLGELRYVRGDLVPAPWEPLASMVELPARRVCWDGKDWVTGERKGRG